MPPSVDELTWAFMGNVVIGMGAGTSTLAAFAPTLPLVDGSNPLIRVTIISAGFILFFAGYRLSQAGIHRDPDESLVASFLPDSGSSDSDEDIQGGDSDHDKGSAAVRGGLTLLGALGLGTGMRLFALTIDSWDPVLGLSTGVVCIGGYIAGHLGINGVVL